VAWNLFRSPSTLRLGVVCELQHDQRPSFL
jgi:hypothetical protein